MPHLQGSEKDLLARLKAGERSAFDEVMRRFHQPLLRLAASITGDRESGEDVVQDAFFRFWQGIGQFNGRASLSTYLYRITLNRAVDRIRGRRRRDGAMNRFRHQVDAVVASPAEKMEREDLLHAALGMLPVKFKVPLLLLEVEQMAYREIADVLGLTLNTVRSRVFRAREKMVATLRALEGS